MKEEEISCSNIKKTIQKLYNFHDVIKEDGEHYNLNLLQVPAHPYRILISAGSGSKQTSSFFNVISLQPDIYEIYLYTKDPNEVKYLMLFN